jgi:hypothetical protein
VSIGAVPKNHLVCRGNPGNHPSQGPWGSEGQRLQRGLCAGGGELCSARRAGCTTAQALDASALSWSTLAHTDRQLDRHITA